VPISPKEAVDLGIKIGEMLGQADVTAGEGVKITLSIATFAAVEILTEEQFINLCRAAYRDALTVKNQIQATEEIEKTN